MVEMCCSLNLNSITGILTIIQIRRSVNWSNFAQSRIRYCWLEWMTSSAAEGWEERGYPPPCKKILIGFVHISGVALGESGWVQTHPNPPKPTRGLATVRSNVLVFILHVTTSEDVLQMFYAEAFAKMLQNICKTFLQNVLACWTHAEDKRCKIKH